MSYPSFETGHTVQFTWTSSVPPDSAPIFYVTEPWSSTVVASFSSIQSSTTQYTALYTTSTSQGDYIGTWQATKTVNSSARVFLDRFVFRVQATAIPT